MGRPLGGAGAGNRALTIYMANQLSKRIKAEKIDQIEMQFLHPADTESLIYKYNNKPFSQEIRTAMAVCSLISPDNRAKVSIILQKSGQAVEVGAGLDEADDGHQRLGIDQRVERYVRQVELS